jgi:hypothetical protein
LKKELLEEEYQKLNGSFRAFRKNAQDLNKEERKSLRRFFEHSASAKQAYILREELTAIFNRNLLKKQAQSKILQWVQKVQKSGLHCFDDFLKLINTWWEEITNYFIQRENSGFVEGFNKQGQSSQAAPLRHFPPKASNTYSSVSIWTFMAIVYLPPPHMTESRLFPESQARGCQVTGEILLYSEYDRY